MKQNNLEHHNELKIINNLINLNVFLDENNFTSANVLVTRNNLDDLNERGIELYALYPFYFLVMLLAISSNFILNVIFKLYNKYISCITVR